MSELDHLILRVSDAQASARFYERILGLRRDGFCEPFEVLRVSGGTTLDLLAEVPRDPAHLAFRLDRPGFDAVRTCLQAEGIVFGGDPFVRDGRTAPQLGALGWGESLYFSDPDGHSIEVRTHDGR